MVADGGFDPAALARFLEGRMAKWWVPAHWAEVSVLPRTTVGKADKAAMRRMLAAGELIVRTAGARA